MTRRVLVLRALGLGDLLTGVPALRALRRALPDHELVLAAPEPLRPLVECSGTVDTLLPTGELAPVPWSGPSPEVAVDLHGNGPASKRLLQDLAPGRLVAFAGPGRGGTVVAGPPWRAEEHEVVRWCRLVQAAFGRSVDSGDLRLAVPSVPPVATGAVVVHAGAASGSRRWPEERFAAVARWAADAGEQVLLTGTGAERALVERVRRRAGLSAAACLAGRTGLAELASTVAFARLVVCGDTGAAHLASAYGTPSVVLFGPTPPRLWGPPADGPHSVLWHGTGRGDPHAARPDPALLRITVDEVVEQARLRLRSRPTRPAPARSDPSARPPTRSSV